MTVLERKLFCLPQVIDTSYIIKDVDDALKSKKTFCLLEDDTEFKVLSDKNHCFKKNINLVLNLISDCHNGL